MISDPPQRPDRKILRAISMWGAALALSAPLPARAADVSWNNSAGGTFNVSLNWVPNTVPGATDHAHFPTDGNYRVSWTADAANANAVIHAASGTMTQHLGGFTWRLTNSYVIGTNTSSVFTVAQTNGTLRVTNSARTALYEVRRGTNRFESGLIEADYLTLTNTGRFVFHGGTLITYGGFLSNGVPFNLGAGGDLPAFWNVRAGANTVLASALNVGGLVPGCILSVTNGGRVFSASGRVGNGSVSNMASLTGGSVWSNQTFVDVGVGSASSFNRLVVSNQASLYNASTFVGSGSAANSNVVIVINPGSVWINRDDIRVGNPGAFNRMEVTNGGKVFTASASFIGGSTSSNNLVVVTGTGSTWSNAAALTVGQSGPGNMLVISNGAAVWTDGLILGANSGSTNNRLHVRNIPGMPGLVKSSLFITNASHTAALDIRRGTNRFDQGLIETDVLRMTNSLADFDWHGGALNVRTSVVTGRPFIIGDGGFDDTDFNMVGNGTHTFANGVILTDDSTLSGSGTVMGHLTAEGVGHIEPGAGHFVPGPRLGRIVLNESPDLHCEFDMDISRNGSVLTNDVFEVNGTLTYGDLLEVSDLGPDPLMLGDRFRLFRASAYGGGFSRVSLPPLPPEWKWVDHLLQDGSIEVAAVSPTGNTSTWKGSLASGFWSNNVNWVSGRVPVPGDDLLFPSGALQLVNTNDLPPNTPFNSIAITANGCDLRGNAVRLFASLASSTAPGASDPILTLPITLTAPGHPITVNAGPLLVNGVLSGDVSDAGITKLGPGKLQLNGNNSYAGTTTVNAGVLLVNGSQPQSPICIGALGILGGSGTVGNITNASGGVVAPGSSTAILTCGDVEFSGSASRFAVELNGTVAGPGYDQLKVRGTVNLGDATLDLAFGFVPSVGATFRVLDNDGTDPVLGTFHGLPDGALFDSGPARLRILYSGGTGNDITLTVVQLIKVWIGASDGYWSNGANWSGGIAPQAGELLVFPPDALRFMMTNDFTPARVFDRATFTGSNYFLRGQSLLLSHGIFSGQLVSTNFIVSDVELRGPQSFVVSNASAGLLVLGSALTLGANALTVDGSGRVEIAAAIGGVASVTKQGDGTLGFSGGSANTFSGGVTVFQGTLDLGKTASDGAIAGSLQVGSLGAPPLPLTTNATVRWRVSNQLNNSADVLVTSEGLLDLSPLGAASGAGDEIGSLHGNGSINLGGAFLKTGGTGLDTVFDGVIGGAAGRVQKAGAGRFVLNGPNTYSGTTLILGGTLEVNGFQPASGINVFQGSALAGRGVVGVLTNVSGTIRPGASPGLLTSSNFVCFGSTATCEFELNGPARGTRYDSVTVRGPVQLNNALLVVSSGFAPDEGQTFLLLDNDGTDAVNGVFRDGNGTGLALSEGATFSAGGLPWRISYAGGTGNDVTLTVGRLVLGAGTNVVQAGNGNGRVDPNECNNLLLEIVNRTNRPLSGVTARLTTPTSGVVITERDAVYPAIPAGGSATNLTPFQFYTTPEFLCGTPVEFVLEVTTPADGRFALHYQLQGGSLGPEQIFSNVTPLILPDDGSAESTIHVGGVLGPVGNVTVSVFLTNANLFNLGLALRSPDGTAVTLVPSFLVLAGGSLGTNCDTGMTVFSDSAAMTVFAGLPPYVGSFRPQSPLSVFQGKSGAAVNGDWSLRVSDGGDPDGAQMRLECWTLAMAPFECAAGGGPCSPCNGPFFGSITAADTVFPFTMDIVSTPSTCGGPVACNAEPANFIPTHYDLYAFTNGGAAACVTVELTMPCANPANVFFSGAYSPAFDPVHHCAHLIGASGRVTNEFTTYSFQVAANGVFQVLVISLGGSLCPAYTLRVDGFDCPATLGIGSAGPGLITVQWPTYVGVSVLQCDTNIPFSNPVVVTNAPHAIGGQFVVTNSVIAPAGFYRLVLP